MKTSDIIACPECDRFNGHASWCPGAPDYICASGNHEVALNLVREADLPSMKTYGQREVSLLPLLNALTPKPVSKPKPAEKPAHVCSLPDGGYRFFYVGTK